MKKNWIYNYERKKYNVEYTESIRNYIEIENIVPFFIITSQNIKIIINEYFPQKLKKLRKMKNIVLNAKKSLMLNFSNLPEKPLFDFD